ncbi:MAG TPA: HipA domain-containing protein [Aldersonia sp.]
MLMIERFDREPGGKRRIMVSGPTMLGLDEMMVRYATYPDPLDVLRRDGAAPRVGRKLFERIVFNVAVGNSDDHARNHAAFWDGHNLRIVTSSTAPGRSRPTTPRHVRMNPPNYCALPYAPDTGLRVAFSTRSG